MNSERIWNTHQLSMALRYRLCPDKKDAASYWYPFLREDYERLLADPHIRRIYVNRGGNKVWMSGTFLSGRSRGHGLTRTKR